MFVHAQFGRSTQNCLAPASPLAAVSLYLFAAWLFQFPATGNEYNSLAPDIKSSLLSGEVVLLSRRPGEKGKIDKKFTIMAKLMKGTRSEIWAVIIDKEDSEKFLDNVLESKIISAKGNEIIMEQNTRVGGPKGSYRYTLKYTLTPEKKAEFSFVKGEIKNVEGAWWIFDGPDQDRQLVIYALHIDPGLFAPQFVVKKGMKKTIPGTILSTEKEMLRRQKLKQD